MKIALVHDHLAQDGGAERVVTVFQEMFPKAPLYVLVHDKKCANKVFANKDIRTSYLQNLPLGVKKYQWYLALMPNAVEQQNLMPYDLVISSCSMFSKGVITRPDAVHICYCHTPTRFLWTDTHDYVKELRINKIFKKFVPLVLTVLRIWDRISANRVDYYIANSKAVQRRIAKYYRRSSEVIYPPVETHKYKIADKIGDYFVSGGRLVTYKRFDLIVQAFNRTGINVKIWGKGPDLERLKKMARKNIEFLGYVSEADKAKLYSEARAFINPQEEDFGITSVESMAAGRPVIAYAKGGALEIVQPGKTGELFTEQSWEELADYVVRFDERKYDPQYIKNYAEQFSVERFKNEMQAFIDKVV